MYVQYMTAKKNTAKNSEAIGQPPRCYIQPLRHSNTRLALAVYVTPSQHIDRIGSELRHSVLTMRRDGAAPPIGQGFRTYPTVGHGSRVKRWLYRAMAHHVIHHLSKVSGGSVVQPLKRNPRGAPRLSG